MFNILFYYDQYLTSINLENFYSFKVIDMNNMFAHCASLTTLDLSDLDTGSVTDMSFMFYDTKFMTSLTGLNFDTRNVTNMLNMFLGMSIIEELDISSFDTRNVTNMKQMFFFSFKLKTIYASDTFVVNDGVDSTDMFGWCSELVGGAGTTYEYSRSNGSHARIDGGPDNPGFFTRKS